MSILNYFGKSKGHYSNAAQNLEAAKESGTNAFNSACSIGSTILSSDTIIKTALSVPTAFSGFEFVAGKIISTNAAMQFANLFTASSEISIIA